MLFLLQYRASLIETGHVAYILYMPHVLFLLMKPQKNDDVLLLLKNFLSFPKIVI